MRTRSWKGLALVLVVLLAPVIAWHGWFVSIAALSPFAWEERDWDGDGRVTYSEFIASSSYGKRPAPCPGGALGTEYFDTKSGLEHRTDCGRVWTGPHEARFI